MHRTLLRTAALGLGAVLLLSACTPSAAEDRPEGQVNNDTSVSSDDDLLVDEPDLLDEEPGDPGQSGDGPGWATDGDWVLVSGTGPDGPVEPVRGHEATVSLSGFSLGGYGGCNQIGFAHEDGEELTDWPTDIISTMMWCEHPAGIPAQESALVTALSQRESIEVEAGQLVLTGGGYELRFERA